MKRTLLPPRAVSLFASIALALLLCPSPALAVTQEEVDAAQAELDQLTFIYEQAADELEQTRASLSESQEQMSRLEGQVDETTQRYDQAQSNLREYTRNRYKQGNLNILQAVFSAKSFDELVSTIHYARSVEAHGIEIVHEVNDIREELTQEQDSLLETIQEQDELMMQQEEQLAGLGDAQMAQQEYLDGLSAELLEQIELERARAAEEEARRIEEEKAKEEEEQKAREQEEQDAEQPEDDSTKDADDAEQKPSDDQQPDKPEEPKKDDEPKQDEEPKKDEETPDTDSTPAPEPVTPEPVVQDQGDVVTGEDIARLAVQIAPTATPTNRLGVATPHTRPTDSRCAAYLAVHDAVWNRVFKGRYSYNYPYYASCAPAVMKVIQYSNADVNMDVLPSGSQYRYFQSSPLWTQVTVSGNPSFDSICKPGDVITRPGHTMLYVGNDLVRERFPNSGGGMWEAAQTARLLPGITGGQHGGAAGWYIFRLVPHKNPHVY